VGGVRVGSGDPASESSACSVTLGVWKGGTGFVKLLGVLVCPDSDAQFKIPACEQGLWASERPGTRGDMGSLH
jgi:hypothetical protein